MTLSPGTQLGPYTLLRVLGTGGMGEVYLAQDGRLGREVAVKVLLPAFATDTDRLRRFEQEARSIASLNHPNVLQVYDTGLHEGTPFLVMELLEGRTLRERLASGPLSPRRAGELALQIAQGLAAAHDKGITHRDLKPENIFLVQGDRVKILDFGLAKLRNPLPTDSSDTQDGPTVPMETRLGVMVGTVGYMSPEQVNGQPADPRSDLFAFGVILWEMLRGTRPFRGGSVVETLHAILKDELPEAEEAALPEGLSWILRRCLQKDPKSRFQSATDLCFELERALATLSPGSGSVLRPALRFRRLRGKASKVLGAAAAALALLGLGWGLGRQGSAGPVPRISRLTHQGGVITTTRWVPGGDSFVFALAQDARAPELWIGRTDGVGVRPLGLPRGTELLSVSIQGELAVLLPGSSSAFGAFARIGTLARVSMSGGAPREVLEQVLEADWSPDGQELAVIRRGRGGALRVEYPIGTLCYEAPEGLLMDGLRVSPKGDRVAFIVHPGAGRTEVHAADRKGRLETLLKADITSYQWGPDGSELIFTQRLPRDAQELRTLSLRTGRNRALQPIIGRIYLEDVSRRGELLLRHQLSRLGMVAQGPKGEEHDLSWLQSSDPADLSPDAGKVLFGEMREGRGPGGAYLRALDGSEAVRLGDGDPLALSRDGRWAMVRALEGPPDLVLLPTGPGQVRHLPSHGVKAEWVSFLRDGQHILLGGVAQGSKAFRYYLQNLSTGALRVWREEGSPEAVCLVSPDGLTVALGPETDGKVHLYPLEGGGPGRVLGEVADGENLLQWSGDGKAIFTVNLQRMPAQVFRWDLATGRRSLWREAAPPQATGTTGIKNLVMDPEGKTLVYSVRRALVSDLYLMEGWR